jgi:hypothetical protein
MTRRKETECEDPAWLSSPEKAEIDQVLRDIEKEVKERKMKQVGSPQTDRERRVAAEKGEETKCLTKSKSGSLGFVASALVTLIFEPLVRLLMSCRFKISVFWKDSWLLRFLRVLSNFGLF